jgi:alpha-ketoglutarate-dependent taurine dioxygenase
VSGRLPDGRSFEGIEMTYNHIRVEPLSTAIGAEIGGVDLAERLPGEVFAEISRAFGIYGVLFFRDQRLTPEQQLALPSASVRSTSTASLPLYPAIR